MIYHKTILDAVGKTPLVKLNRIAKNLKPQIFAKLESHNAEVLKIALASQ